MLLWVDREGSPRARGWTVGRFGLQDWRIGNGKFNKDSSDGLILVAHTHSTTSVIIRDQPGMASRHTRIGVSAHLILTLGVQRVCANSIASDLICEMLKSITPELSISIVIY